MKWLNPGIWLAFLLAFGATAIGFHFEGKSAQRKEDAARQLKDISAARESENELQRINARATSAYIERIRKQLEKASALPKIALPVDCPVPVDVGRLLNDAQLGVRDDAGSGPDTGAAGAETDSTCAAELDIAKRNYAEVCVPNAEQLTEIQERWAATKKKVNREE